MKFTKGQLLQMRNGTHVIFVREYSAHDGQAAVVALDEPNDRRHGQIMKLSALQSGWLRERITAKLEIGQHTPAPWTAVNLHEDNRFPSVRIGGLAPYEDGSGYYDGIVTINDCSPGADLPVHRANACLIAAAPDMLEALHGTRIGLSVLLCLAGSARFQDMTVKAAIAELAANGAWPGDVSAGLAKLDGIIAKAEGRS